jgi:hypothetical protein
LAIRNLCEGNAETVEYVQGIKVQYTHADVVLIGRPAAYLVVGAVVRDFEMPMVA